MQESHWINYGRLHHLPAGEHTPGDCNGLRFVAVRVVFRLVRKTIRFQGRADGKLKVKY